MTMYRLGAGPRLGWSLIGQTLPVLYGINTTYLLGFNSFVPVVIRNKANNNNQQEKKIIVVVFIIIMQYYIAGF